MPPSTNDEEDRLVASYPDLKDKVIFLTGVGQTGDLNEPAWGNGAATARLLASQGAHVFGCDLNLDAALWTQTRIAADGAQITVTKADVTKSEDVKRAVDECFSKYGRIDVLVNNVGRSEPGGPAELTEHIWDAQTDINLKSVYLTCHNILPIMEKQGSGAIVNVSSIAGLRYIGKPQVAYSAAKAGVIQFTKATAVIYAPKNIRLNTVVPGLMDTPLVKVLAEKYAGGDIEGFVAKRHAAVPMGKMGNSLDVAMAVTFLASQQSRYITGQKIVVDGGITSSTG
ncbi:putative short-chain dehydrogenases/reductase [Ilyonectria sp. MPI-CAGE-AT-0026]|nr:putative short-chain dehydrogenases/reductase [Ilyonectria sp. MPI-CAGE-AT-0026]